jgi:ATP phosphoribosyltransferase regulatory subunit
VLIPLGSDRPRAAALRAEGWITVAALAPAADWTAEARRLGCGYLLDDGKPKPVSGARSVGRVERSATRQS